ncbi:MAG: 50S ribosomal protein L6, partial [Oscillospiraceae bacterium]
MSRIGNMPITIPAGVDVKIGENNEVTVKGPKGELIQKLPQDIILEINGDVVNVKRPTEAKMHKSLHGLTRTLFANMVTGVTDGFKRELQINGVGYRAQKQGNKLIMNLGYSHLVEMEEIDG